MVHNLQSIREQGVGHPEVKVGRVLRDGSHGQFLDFLERHGGIPGQALVLRGHFSGSVLKLPGRIGQDGG